jgi:hypothetical protein
VRRVPVPDAKIRPNGVEPKSLIPALKKVCQVAGRGTRIEGVYLEAIGVFENLNKLVMRQKLRIVTLSAKNTT